MRNKIVVLAFCASIAAFGQAVPKAPKMPAKVYSSEPILINDATRHQNVLVLNENLRTFAPDVKSVTDTLSAKYSYRVLTHSDSIRRYSNSKFVRKVMIVEKVK